MVSSYVTDCLLHMYCLVYYNLSTHTDSKNAAENFIKILVGHVSGSSYKSWGDKDKTHRNHAERDGIFRAIWSGNDGNLPWRLSQDERKRLSARMEKVLWPHYLEPLYYRGASMWSLPGRMWKARRKYRLLFHMLPTQLRDQVPAFRDALILFVWSIRRLTGRSCL